MLAIATVVAALLLSLLITRIATIALSVTGMSRESARFQARSAFTGVGFTTSEAERVVNHPIRRRIVLLLMLLGNAGLVTIVASLLISFSGGEESSEAWHRIALLFVGLLAVFLLATSSAVDKTLTKIITGALGRFTKLDVRDYAALLQLQGGYGVIELEVQPWHWVARQKLEDLRLRQEGVAVLGIQRQDKEFIGVPAPDTTIAVGDILVLYGDTSLLAELGERGAGPEGDSQHESAASAHIPGRTTATMTRTR